MDYRIGLDVGTASLGISVFRIDDNRNAEELLMIDEVIFGEPVEPKTMVTSNSIRRAHRLARRQISNRKKRLKKIAHVFNLLNVGHDDIKKLQNCDVYELRVKAMQEKITLAEFCRVCFYLAKHRGYKGDLKEGDIKQRIAQTEALLGEEKSLAEVMLERKKAASSDNSAWYKTHDAGTFIYRKDVEKEFEAAFRKQQEFYPELSREYPIVNENYFPDLKGNTNASFFEILHSAIFYQRPIKWKLDSVGKCSLEKDKFRASTGQLAFQRYRIAKKLSDLRLVRRKKSYNRQNDDLPLFAEQGEFNERDERRLTQDEMRKIFDFVCLHEEEYSKTNTYPLSKVYALIDVDKKVYRFNFETSFDDGSSAAALKGLSTNRVFRDCGVFAEWQELADNVRECVIEFLTNVTKFADIQENTDGNIREQAKKLLQNIAPDDDILSKAVDFILMLKHKEVFYSADFKLEHGRASYCCEVLENLTEYLLNGGQEFEFVEKFYPVEERAVGALRPVDEVKIGNPVIDRALVQLERQIKYIVKTFGSNPQEIIIELSRDMKNSLEERGRMENCNKNTEQKRSKAAEELRSFGIIGSARNIERYLLWKELDNGKCPYCGKVVISQTMAFSPEAEIDHIIPQGAGGANTYSNKILCCKDCNLQKNKRTPYIWSLDENCRIDFEWTKKFGKFLFTKKSANNMYEDKKILQKKAFNLTTEDSLLELTAGFADRQNNQTAWIGKIVLDWLKDICSDVQPSFGKLTAYMRQNFGFATVLPEVRLMEHKALYNKLGKTINSKIWHKFFLSHLTLTDIKCLPEDEKEREIMLAVKEDFETYCKQLENTSIQIDTEEKKFEHFISDLRSSVELTFDKRCDHRHHIIDAVIIGLCNLRLVQAANSYAAVNGSLSNRDKNGRKFKPENLYDGNLREELKYRLLHYVPWHKPDHFPSGELFQQTAYNVKEKDGVKRLVKHADIDEVFTKGEKYIEAVVVQEHTKKLMLKALKNGEKSIFINGNKVKKVRIFYNMGMKTLIEFSDKDIEFDAVNGGKKYYQNSGYACSDFDKTTGKRIDLIPLWKYLRIKNDPVPENVERIFINDIVYDKDLKKFFVVKQFSGRDGLKLKEITEINGDLRSVGSIKDFSVIRNRSDIAKVKGK